MIEILYYIGFLYLIDILVDIWKQFKPIKKEDSVSLSDKSSLTEAVGISQEIFKKSNKIEQIVSILFFAWSLMGYFSNTEEKYWFLANAITSIIFNVFATLLGFLIVHRIIFSNKAKVQNDNAKPININLHSIYKYKIFIELLFVSVIVCLHFLGKINTIQ